MPQVLYLPITEPTSGRETLLYIPGASSMDVGQLREIIAAHTEKAAREMKVRGRAPKARYSKKQVAGALREYRQHLERKANSSGNPRYF